MSSFGNPVMGGNRSRDSQVGTEHFGTDPADRLARQPQHALDHRRVGVGVGPGSPDDLAFPSLLFGQSGQRRVIHVENDDTGIGEYFTLGIDDRLFGAEPLEMHRPDRGDGGKVGSDEFTQLGNLSLCIGAHLRHEDFGPGSEMLVDRRGRGPSSC